MTKKIPGEVESEIPSNELSELLMEIKPYVRQANYSEYARGNSDERKILDYLLLYTEGEGVINIDNKNYNLSKNSLFMIPPNILHSFSRTDNINNVWHVSESS